ncbi:hypothetical protein Tco_0217197, partial [Tanacetum coccineum]
MVMASSFLTSKLRPHQLGFEILYCDWPSQIEIRQRSYCDWPSQQELGKAKRYFTTSRGYRVYNKRTKVIVETIYVNIDELPLMASDHVSSDPVPQCPTTALEHGSLSPSPQCQENVPQEAKTLTKSNELELLFRPMFDELLNGPTQVVSKSSAVNAADAYDKR